jgi:hypothetical protein
MNDAEPSNKKAPYKRRLTDKRRDQNRAAQKIYRSFISMPRSDTLSRADTNLGARRKERLELLEREVATLKDQGKEQDPDHDTCGQESSPTIVRTETAISELGDKQSCPLDWLAVTPLNDPSITGLRKLLEVNSLNDTDALLQFALKENPHIGKIVLTGLRALKLESDLASGSGAPCPSQVAQSSVWLESWLKMPHHRQLLPDILADTILFRQQPMLDVFHYNCQKIGLRLEDLARTGSTTQSPWYSPFASIPSSLVPLDTIPPDLYPTPAQRSFPHHPFLDLIPFPWFRERTITLDSLDPPPFDRLELKQDIISNGMICWKSRAGSEGLPWDRRSWEVQPWFWTKWSWLIEEQGKVEQQSRWWRALREQ